MISTKIPSQWYAICPIPDVWKIGVSAVITLSGWGNHPEGLAIAERIRKVNFGEVEKDASASATTTSQTNAAADVVAIKVEAA